MVIAAAGGPAEPTDLARLFPDAPGPRGKPQGGWPEARRRLAALDPARYGASRNHLDGAVSRLSPWIRHGVLTLAAVRQAVLAAAPAGPADSSGAGRLIQQLAWRDYWQRLWLQWGDAVHHDREPLRTGLHPGRYHDRLPADLAAASTGLACIDAFAAELLASGWLHNHARLWLAAYVVHWRRVRWQAGARWFHSHLLDGDPASNSLSWQWVASSFSTKPYIFNRANLERFGAGHHCSGCPAAARGDASVAGGCPFDADYPWLQQRLFPSQPQPEPPASPAVAPAMPVPIAGTIPAGSVAAPRAPVLWIHAEALGGANPALKAHPGRPALFVLDPAQLACPSLGPWSGKRLSFLQECLEPLPLTIRTGDTVAELLAFVAQHRADGIVTSGAVDPLLRRAMAALAGQLPLTVLDPEPFLATAAGEAPPDLRRFSRYWRWAEPRLLGGRPA